MLICLSIRNLTIFFEKALFTILIVMIHLFIYLQSESIRK
jgi:hypothetical protein